MRTFLIFLIIMNVLYAAWEYINPAMQANSIPPLADNLKTLELLHEQDGLAGGDAVIGGTLEQQGEAGLDMQVENTPTISDSLAEQDLESDGVPVDIVDACYTLGPFREKNIMQQVRDSLAEQVSDISTRKKNQSEKHRYWVYIPASGGRNGAKQMARQLKEKKVKDFYIVLRGETKNSISLGHFREPKHASRRVKRINALGFNAEINVIYRDHDVYWLDYRLIGESQQKGFSVKEYAAEGVSQISRACE